MLSLVAVPCIGVTSQISPAIRFRRCHAAYPRLSLDWVDAVSH
jgi:hypothetical protein